MAREPTTRQLAASLASGALSGRGAMVSLMIESVKTLAAQMPRARSLAPASSHHEMLS